MSAGGEEGARVSRVDAYRGQRPGDLSSHGWEFIRGGRYNDALGHYQDALAAHPQDLHLRVDLGRTMTLVGGERNFADGITLLKDTARAEKAQAAAESRAPSVEPLVALAELYGRVGQVDDMLAFYNLVARREPNHPQVKWLIGTGLLENEKIAADDPNRQQKEEEQAKTRKRNAEKLEDWSASDQVEPHKKLLYCDQAVALVSKDAVPYATLVRAELLARADPEQALEDAQRIVSLETTSARYAGVMEELKSRAAALVNHLTPPPPGTDGQPVPDRQPPPVSAETALQQNEPPASRTLETTEAPIRLLQEQAEQVRKVVEKWEVILLGKVGKEIPERLLSPEAASERETRRAESGMSPAEARSIFQREAPNVVTYEVDLNDPDVVKRLYRKLAREYHPDVNEQIADPTEKANRMEKFKQLSTAWEVLENALKHQAPPPREAPIRPQTPPEQQPKPSRLRALMGSLRRGPDERLALENKSLQDLTIDALTEITASYKALAEAMVKEPSLVTEVDELYLQNTLRPLLGQNATWFTENGDKVLQEIRKRRTGQWDHYDVERRLPKETSDETSWESRARREYNELIKLGNPVNRLVVLVGAQALGRIVDIVANQPYEIREGQRYWRLPEGDVTHSGPPVTARIRLNPLLRYFVETGLDATHERDFQTHLGYLTFLNYSIDYNEYKQFYNRETLKGKFDPGNVPPGILRAFEESPRVRAIFKPEEFLEIPHRTDIVHST
jgi:tetratricopeptide (TPR) repeat protein